MPRSFNQAKLDSPTARKKLQPWHGVYWNVIAKGCSLGYRRNSATKAGVWYAKYSPPKDVAAGLGGVRMQTTLGAADDFTPADGVTSMTFEQARSKATEWFPVAAHSSTGVRPRRAGYTVTDACHDYLRSQEGHSLYLKQTSSVIERNIVPHLGNAWVERLTRARIEDWMRNIAENRRRKPGNGVDPKSEEALRRAKETGNRILRVLKAALNRCLNEGKVACNGIAWKTVKQFRNVAQTRTRFLSDLEAQKLVAGCPPSFRMLLQGALFTGARYSELLRLRVLDFDPVSSTLLIAQSKSGKPRRIYLDSEASAFFGYICAGRPSGDVIFRMDSINRMMTHRMMEKAVATAGIEPLTFHELRHTAASRWARLGLSLAEIAAQLGHADVRMTQRYAHLCQQTLAAKIRAMPGMGIYQFDSQQSHVIQ
ncbi:MAG: site-specific integrase [Acidobacteria bacterium]|nr:site-specific integrase [Acidobacteriota bacterium]